jgi:hypothetical protein
MTTTARTERGASSQSRGMRDGEKTKEPKKIGTNQEFTNLTIPGTVSFIPGTSSLPYSVGP